MTKISMATMTPSEKGIDLDAKEITFEVDGDTITLPLYNDEGSKVYEEYMKKINEREAQEDREYEEKIKRLKNDDIER